MGRLAAIGSIIVVWVRGFPAPKIGSGVPGELRFICEQIGERWPKFEDLSDFSPRFGDHVLNEI
jgi:hypothetical protein